MVVTVSELIIPRTETPGARDVGVNRFIDGVLQEAEPGQRESFLRGLAWIDERSVALFGGRFVKMSAAQQTSLLTGLAGEDDPSEADRAGVDFFRAIKSMTITGYYSSEAGLRRELGDDGRIASAEFAGCNHPEHS
jgi:hypothetical protein